MSPIKMPTVQAAAPDQKSIMPTDTMRPVAKQVGSSATKVQITIITRRIQKWAPTAKGSGGYSRVSVTVTAGGTSTKPMISETTLPCSLKTTSRPPGNKTSFACGANCAL